jgi:hypothetical protein
MTSLPQEEAQSETRQLENNLFQQMAKVQQPLSPEAEPQEQEDQS